MAIRHGLACLLLLLLTGFPGIAAELVITKSTVIGFEPGMVIDGSQELSLRKGHQLSLISPTGKVIKLKGPYKGIPDSSGKTPGSNSIVDKLSTLVAGRRQGSRQLGAIRPGDSSRRVDPFPIDITSGGDQCVVSGMPVKLWIPGGAPTKSVWIARTGSDDAAKINWPTGTVSLEWPKKVPVVDGAEYEFLRRPAKEETVLKLHIVPAFSGNKAELMISMYEKNCVSQANALVEAQ